MNRTKSNVLQSALAEEGPLRGLAIAVLFLLCSIIACQDPVEGCLDVNATNYSVAADDPCSDCCTYPTFSLQIFHRFDSLVFSFDSIYEFAGSDAKFQQSIFYLSDFKLLSLTDSFEVIDTITLDIIGAGTEVFKDDYTLVSRSVNSFEYEVGEIRGKGTYSALRFKVGLAGNAAFANAEVLPEEHPLALSTDTLWTFPEGYVFHRVIIEPDTLLDPSVTRQIDIKGPSRLVEITLSLEKEIELGFDLEVPLKIDYKEWFSGIDFVGDDVDTITEKIVTNTANAFSINE